MAEMSMLFSVYRNKNTKHEINSEDWAAAPACKHLTTSEGLVLPLVHRLTTFLESNPHPPIKSEIFLLLFLGLNLFKDLTRQVYSKY